MQTLDVEQWFFGSGGSNAGSSSSIVGSVVSPCSPPPSSTSIGDYIGNESCLDLTNDDGIFLSSSRVKESDQRYKLLSRRGDRRWTCKKEKEFPPPIPLLARTENLPCHMPWVLRRYYTSDGRLILKEERVKHHGYFRARRSNGRLTLQLVSLDDEDDSTHYSSEDGENEREMEKFCNEESEEAFTERQANDNGGDVDGNSIMKQQFLKDKDQARVASSATNGNVISNFKCFDCSRMSLIRPGAPCNFEMPLPAISPKEILT